MLPKDTILNIFWKHKIVKTVWPVRVKSSVLAFMYITQYEIELLLELYRPTYSSFVIQWNNKVRYSWR